MAARDHFRAYERRRVDLGATLRDRPVTQEQPVRIRDLGLGGAGIEVGEAQLAAGPFEPESAITLQVTAPTLWDPLSLHGKVAWVRRGQPGRPTRAGIRFEHQDPTALYALHQLLGAHAFDL